MHKVSRKDFFRMLCENPSAKVGVFTIDGEFTPTAVWLAEQMKEKIPIAYRRVIHQQSNAIMFDNESWFFFDKPSNCDYRQTFMQHYQDHDMLIMVDHRPAYSNQFGTPIKEITTVLIYALDNGNKN